MPTLALRLPALACLPALLVGCSQRPLNPNEEEVAHRTTLVQYQSCQALEADLKEMFIAEVEARFAQLGSDHWGLDSAGEGAAEPGADPGGDERQEGSDFSGTNNQESGVDEADFLKTDGYHVYVLSGGEFHIFGVPEFGELVPASSTPIEGYPQQMLISRSADTAVVFSAVWPGALPEDHPLAEELGEDLPGGWMWRASNLSKITVFDISDRESPAVTRELFLEGSYNTARMIDTSVRLAAFSWLNIPGLYDWWWYYHDAEYDLDEALAEAKERIMALSLDEIIPRAYELKGGTNLVSHSLTGPNCKSFRRPQDSRGRGVTSILSFDVTGPAFHLDSNQVVSNWPTIYSSRDYMYIAEAANDWWWFWWNKEDPELLNLHMFDVRTAGKTDYLGSGRVEGYLLNQFSLSEHEGYLRAAVTTGRWGWWWGGEAPPPENHLYVLGLKDGALEVVGYVGGLAEGERIFSARMVGDKGYIVTFEDIDPLFTLDLSDPADPRVIGELKIPGFSTYIHPLEGEKLLTIGIGGDDTGVNWRTQVSLFDVSDFSKPVLADSLELIVPGEWGWSEALYEHKAFQYWAPKGLLAVPLSSYAYDGNDFQYTSRLELVTVDPETGLGNHGTVDHSHLFNSEQGWFWMFRDVRRSIFMGEFLYAVSDRGITVHQTATLEKVTEQPLPGWGSYHGW